MVNKELKCLENLTAVIYADEPAASSGTKSAARAAATQIDDQLKMDVAASSSSVAAFGATDFVKLEGLQLSNTPDRVADVKLEGSLFVIDLRFVSEITFLLMFFSV